MGALIAMSTKQKLNTTSSTEAEVADVSDSTPFNIGATEYFFKARGRGGSNYTTWESGMFGIRI